MRDPDRIDEVLAALRAVWIQQDQLRLGQLVVIATSPSSPCPEVFNIEDDALLKGLLSYGKLLADHRQRHGADSADT